MESMTGKKTGAPPAAALVRPVATGILIGSAFLLIFLFALHKPAPDGVPVGVVGPVSVSETIPAGSGLDLRTLGSTAQARQEIKHNTIYAAYVVQGVTISCWPPALTAPPLTTHWKASSPASPRPMGRNFR